MPLKLGQTKAFILAFLKQAFTFFLFFFYHIDSFRPNNKWINWRKIIFFFNLLQPKIQLETTNKTNGKRSAVKYGLNKWPVSTNVGFFNRPNLPRLTSIWTDGRPLSPGQVAWEPCPHRPLLTLPEHSQELDYAETLTTGDKTHLGCEPPVK